MGPDWGSNLMLYLSHPPLLSERLDSAPKGLECALSPERQSDFPECWAVALTGLGGCQGLVSGIRVSSE